METHACRVVAIAAGEVSAPAAFISPEPPAPWHETVQVRRIFAAIDELGTIAARLDAIDHEHRFLGIADAGATLGRLIVHEERSGLGQDWRRVLRPSNGGSAVAQLWDQLASIRDAWIHAQMRAAGHAVPYHALPDGLADAAWAAWDALEQATPGVQEARAMFTT